MSDPKHRLPKLPAHPRPKTMRQRYYSLSPSEREFRRCLLTDPYSEVRVERLRQHYRDIAGEDPTKAEGLAEMLGLLDELEDLNKELRECFYKEIPEARPIDR